MKAHCSSWTALDLRIHCSFCQSCAVSLADRANAKITTPKTCSSCLAHQPTRCSSLLLKRLLTAAIWKHQAGMAVDSSKLLRVSWVWKAVVTATTSVHCPHIVDPFTKTCNKGITDETVTGNLAHTPYGETLCHNMTLMVHSLPSIHC